MAEQRQVSIDRITLEPIPGNGLWRVRVEGGDVEGHNLVPGGISVEPAGEDEEGEVLFRVSLDGEDVEGHGPRFGGMPAIPPLGEGKT